VQIPAFLLSGQVLIHSKLFLPYISCTTVLDFIIPKNSSEGLCLSPSGLFQAIRTQQGVDNYAISDQLSSNTASTSFLFSQKWPWQQVLQ
jgi:hypothetical protein